MAKTSSVGATQEMMFNVPASLVPSEGIEMRVQPATGSGAYTQSGSVVRFVIGEHQNTFLQNDTLSLSGTITFTGSTSPGAENSSALLGSAYSWIARQTLYHNNTLLETVDNPSLINNALISLAVNSADKGVMSVSHLYHPSSPSTNLGPIINQEDNGFPNSVDYTFSIPLLGLLGSSAKYLPLFAGEYVLELTLNNLGNFVRDIQGPANTPTDRIEGYSVGNLELTSNTIKLEQNSFSALMNSYGGKLQLKADTWTYSAPPSIVGASVGQQDLIYPHKLQSLKRIIWWSSPSDASEKSFAGVNPNLNSYQLYVGNTAYPQMPVKAWSPAENFLQAQKALGSVYSTSHSGSAVTNGWAVASTGGAVNYNAYHRAYNTSNTKADLTNAQKASKWFACLDLEVINNNKQSLFTGINSQGTNSFLRLNIARNLAGVSHQVHVYSNYDCLIEFDLMNKVTTIVQ